MFLIRITNYSPKSEQCPCIIYFIEGEKNPKLQTNSLGSSKVAPAHWIPPVKSWMASQYVSPAI
jgi:hypothetical protein